MMPLKQIAVVLASICFLALIIWLKYLGAKDSTIFSNDEGPQKLFDKDQE